MSEPLFFGIYKGFCTNNQDPEFMNRIKATVPQVFGSVTTETAWALPCTPPHIVVNPPALEPDNLITPVVGVGVWIMFEGGDIEHPVWLGVWASDATVS